MENKIGFYIVLVVVLTACSGRYYLVRGKFFDSMSFVNEQYFSHENRTQKNALKKITESGFGYYSWKTVAYNYEMNNEDYLLPKSSDKRFTEVVSIYKSILNDELLALENDEKSYVMTKGKILMNNLYFIDDHRCIYISYDDDNKIGAKQLCFPLNFDNKNYPVPKKDKKLYEQYLRGYYTIHGNNIFIHFHQPLSNDNYYVYGLILGDAIKFTSITVPKSPRKIYEGGYNAVDVDLEKIFNVINIPIFEWVDPVKYIFYPQQTYLSTGFELYKGKHKNKLHERLLKKYPDIKITKDLIITEISYSEQEDDDGNRIPVRIYTLIDNNPENRSSLNKYEINEFIGMDAMSECILETW